MIDYFSTPNAIELDFAETLWIKYIQNGINLKSYNQFKKDLGFFSQGRVVRCLGVLAMPQFHTVQGI